MKFQILPISLLCLVVLTACTTTEAVVETATNMPSPTLTTATPTIVWFPPTPTFTPFPTMQTTPTTEMDLEVGGILLEDNFDDPTSWNLAAVPGGSIALGKNELTIAIAREREYLFSVRSGQVFDNFYAELTAAPSLCRDKDEYGMLLRVSPELDYYRFSLSCDGQVRLDRIYQNQASSPQPWIPSGAVPPGAPSSSRLGVWASGDEMRFFVNGEYQFTVHEPILGSGTFGVFARSSSDMAVTVNFSDLVVREVGASQQ